MWYLMGSRVWNPTRVPCVLILKGLWRSRPPYRGVSRVLDTVGLGIGSCEARGSHGVLGTRCPRGVLGVLRGRVGRGRVVVQTLVSVVRNDLSIHVSLGCELLGAHGLSEYTSNKPSIANEENPETYQARKPAELSYQVSSEEGTTAKHR